MGAHSLGRACLYSTEVARGHAGGAHDSGHEPATTPSSRQLLFSAPDRPTDLVLVPLVHLELM